MFEAKDNKNLLNPHGSTHGGILFTLCDSTAGSYFEHSGRWGVTTDSTIQFYRASKEGDYLTARLTERKNGRKTATFLLEVLNQEKQLIAEALISVFYTNMEG